MKPICLLFVLLLTSIIACSTSPSLIDTASITPTYIQTLATAHTDVPTLIPTITLTYIQTLAPTYTGIPTLIPTLTTQTSKLGDVVTGYGYSLSGIAVLDPVTENGIGWCKVMPNERIVAVQIAAGNISGDALYTVNPLDFSMVDNEGFVYSSAQCYVDGVEGIKDIQPGQKDRRWLTFIVPIGFTAASVQWNIDSFGDRILMAGLIY